jgi:hypothetical protein
MELGVTMLFAMRVGEIPQKNLKVHMLCEFENTSKTLK